MKELNVNMKKGLSGTSLKIIALILMVIDHIYYFFSFTGYIPEWFSMLGRLSAPLFLFCMVEGFIHTRNRKAYFFKIYKISILMNGLLFFMKNIKILNRPDGFFPMNGIMTAFVILIVIFQGIDWIKEKCLVKGITTVSLPVIMYILANSLSTAFPFLSTPISFISHTFLPILNSNLDASGSIIIMGIILYVFQKNKKTQAFAFFAYNFIYFFVFLGFILSTQADFTWSQMFTHYYDWYASFSAIFMLCYNGKRGKGYQKFFYIFYPVHIYLLYGLSWILYVLIN